MVLRIIVYIFIEINVLNRSATPSHKAQSERRCNVRLDKKTMWRILDSVRLDLDWWSLYLCLVEAEWTAIVIVTAMGENSYSGGGRKVTVGVVADRTTKEDEGR